MQIETLQKFCLSLPAVTEDIKWGNDLVFSIGDKMFCVAALDGPFKCSFKVPDDVYDELSMKDGFMPAPYMARARWVLVTRSAVLSRREWEDYIRNSYELIKAKLTRKVRKDLGIE